MALSRYRNLNTLENKKYLETSSFPTTEQLDAISSIQLVVGSFDRLDILAAKYLGSGEYWWVIAVMNDFSWGFNIPEGTTIRIPTDINQFLKLF